MDRVGEQAGGAIARSGPIVGRAETGDGAFAVEVYPGGRLKSVKLTPFALRSAPEVIARQIVELSDRATRRASDRMYRTLAPVLGRDADRQLKTMGFEPLPDDDERGYGGR
ncbi:YbaB/EbfC family DNA-binding protein [Amycolatopsis suaedae]|uniref:YbaB/EbfC family DNA-binding protein n=2 Tax=Amycolatopsis suaedae TaxID=2510978 RepID=A0A4Q7J8S8_9PSEU|nr:YbaB/EbfC family DNA-binding protein [Amycolatopsis suaedae]